MYRIPVFALGKVLVLLVVILIALLFWYALQVRWVRRALAMVLTVALLLIAAAVLSRVSAHRSVRDVAAVRPLRVEAPQEIEKPADESAKTAGVHPPNNRHNLLSRTAAEKQGGGGQAVAAASGETSGEQPSDQQSAGDTPEEKATESRAGAGSETAEAVAPPSWIDRKPFPAEEARCILWPVTIGPLLADDGSTSTVQLQIGRSLSPEWVELITGNLRQKTAPELFAQLAAMHAAGRLAESPELGGWLPEAVIAEVRRAFQEAVDQYAARFIDPRAAGRVRVPLNQLPGNVVRGVWYEPWNWQGDSQSIPVSTSSLPLSEVAFRVHLLLGFDAELHEQLARQWTRFQARRKVIVVFTCLAFVLAILAIVYVVLQIDLATSGKHRRLLRWAGALGAVALLVMVELLLVLGR